MALIRLGMYDQRRLKSSWVNIPKQIKKELTGNSAKTITFSEKEIYRALKEMEKCAQGTNCKNTKRCYLTLVKKLKTPIKED